MFCPKCGSIMMPKKVEGKMSMSCSCGHSSASGNVTISEKMQDKNDFEVVEEKLSNYPITDEKCKKCGNGKAYFFTKQTRSADEPETKFMKCVKCGHQWRDYA